MSLEATAALLGHRLMRMTMVYARIANRTVGDEYFAVSEKVEALYDAPKNLPAPVPRTTRCGSSALRCTSGCSATAIAPDRLAWTVTSSPTPNRARSSDNHRVPRHLDSPARRRSRQGPDRPQKIFDGLLSRLVNDSPRSTADQSCLHPGLASWPDVVVQPVARMVRREDY